MTSSACCIPYIELVPIPLSSCSLCFFHPLPSEGGSKPAIPASPRGWGVGKQGCTRRGEGVGRRRHDVFVTDPTTYWYVVGSVKYISFLLDLAPPHSPFPLPGERTPTIVVLASTTWLRRFWFILYISPSKPLLSTALISMKRHRTNHLVYCYTKSP